MTQRKTEKHAKSKRESTTNKKFSLQLYQEGLQQLRVWISDLAGSIWGTWPVKRKIKKAWENHKKHIDHPTHLFFFLSYKSTRIMTRSHCSTLELKGADCQCIFKKSLRKFIWKHSPQEHNHKLLRNHRPGSGAPDGKWFRTVCWWFIGFIEDLSMFDLEYPTWEFYY